MQGRSFLDPAAEVDASEHLSSNAANDKPIDGMNQDRSSSGAAANKTTDGKVLRPKFVIAMALIALLACVLALAGQAFIKNSTYHSDEFSDTMDVNGEVQRYNEAIERHIDIVRDMDAKLSERFHEPLDAEELQEIAQTDEFNSLKLSADEILVQADAFERDAELVWRDMADQEIKKDEYHRVAVEAVNIYLKWSGKSVGSEQTADEGSGEQ